MCEPGGSSLKPTWTKRKIFSASTKTCSSDLDVVNLSSQMTSMEILTGPNAPKKRKSNKKVRFEVPETKEKCNNDLDQPTNQIASTVNLSDIERINIKPHCKSCYTVQRVKVSSTAPSSINATDTNEEDTPKRVIKMEIEIEGASIDENENCAAMCEGKPKTKSNRGFITKCQSVMSTVRKLNKNDNSNPLKKSEKANYVKRTKEMHNKKKTSKKTKAEHLYPLTCAKKAQFSERCNNTSKIQCFKKSCNLKKNDFLRISKVTKSVMKQSSNSKTKQSKPSVRTSKEKLENTSRSKDVSLKTRCKQELRKFTQVQNAEQKKAFEATKAQKKICELKMIKEKSESRRKRRPKIIMIERELDVIEPLRVYLLKYLTFQNAHDYDFNCCRSYCCDDWTEIDIYDILDDHD